MTNSNAERYIHHYVKDISQLVFGTFVYEKVRIERNIGKDAVNAPKIPILEQQAVDFTLADNH